ncbi:MAG: hypothetical protein MR598_08745 [Erysipelotrichaceae bacterium]|nr:hypothetical protein [Erysipelotrichaceae bacterium]
MKYTTIFEKILCLFNLVSESWLYIAFIGITAILIILLGLKKLTSKKCFLLMNLACACLFGYMIYQYFDPLSKMTDQLIDNLFTSFYFPSAYAYLFILIVMDVVTIIGVLNPRKEKIYKTIHGTFFIAINFVLTLVLEMIAKNNIDIFSKKSLFSNTDLITLLEFSMNLFALWIIVLVIIYVVNILTEHMIIAKENKVLNTKPANTSIPIQNTLSVELEPEKKESISLPEKETVSTTAFTPDTVTNHFIPTFVDQKEASTMDNIKNSYIQNNSNTITTSMENQPSLAQTTNNNFSYQPSYSNVKTNDTVFDLSSFIPKKQDIRPIQSLNDNHTAEIFDQILKNELPFIKQESNFQKEAPTTTIEQEKDHYTLNDYRIFNKMLKDIREHNQSNSISIDKNLEYRLITKYSTETYNMFKKMLKIYSN